MPTEGNRHFEKEQLREKKQSFSFSSLSSQGFLSKGLV
jgi:hypothetical protein